MSYLYTTLGNS